MAKLSALVTANNATVDALASFRLDVSSRVEILKDQLTTARGVLFQEAGYTTVDEVNADLPNVLTSDQAAFITQALNDLQVVLATSSDSQTVGSVNASLAVRV